MKSLGKRIFASLDALSQWANVTWFPRVEETDPNESISGRSYREGVAWRVKFIDWLFSLYETEHCRKSFEKDYVRSQEFVEKNRDLFNNPRTF